VVTELEVAGVPCAAVRDYASALADPEVLDAFYVERGSTEAAIATPLEERPGGA
jgi:hypothetical protein